MNEKPTRTPIDWKTYIISFFITALIFASAFGVNNLLGSKRQADIKGKLEETGLPVYMVSAALNTSLAELILPVHKFVTEHKTGAPDEMGPEMVFRPRPVDQRD